MAIEITTKPKIRKVPPLVVTGVTICVILGVIIGGSYLYFTFSLKRMNEEIEEKETSAMSLTRAIFEKEAQIIPIKNKIVHNINPPIVETTPTSCNFLNSISNPTINNKNAIPIVDIVSTVPLCWITPVATRIIPAIT